jgi:hypothetical protein
MTTHDPRKVIETLRDHLASHDNRILFLFGAGASAAVKSLPDSTGATHSLIPAVAGLTNLCQTAVSNLGSTYVDAWVLLKDECKSIGKSYNIEALLSRIRTKLDAMSGSDRMLGLGTDELRTLEKTITNTIADAVQPPESMIPEIIPHHALAKWVANSPRRYPIEIFTTNYDMLIEKALEDERVPLFDGFAGVLCSFFVPESLQRTDSSPGSSWVRVWKIHGSVNWQWKEVGSVRRIIRTHPVKTGEMILPSHYKYDESRKQPYVALLDRLRRALDQEDAILITIGYSFSDEHINAIILDALAARQRVCVYSLQFADLSEDKPVWQSAIRLKNLMALGPTSAVIGGSDGEWELNEPLDPRLTRYTNIGFLPTSPGGLKGTFRLGDFSVFSVFLSTLRVP